MSGSVRTACLTWIPTGNWPGRRTDPQRSFYFAVILKRTPATPIKSLMLKPINTPNNHSRLSRAGVSLVEILLAMALVSLMTLPLTLILQGTSDTTKKSAVQMTRNLLLMGLVGSIDPESPDFISRYNDAGMQTITESGTDIAYMRKTDTSNSDNLNKQIHVFMYKDPTDATTSSMHKLTHSFFLDEIRIDVGASQGFQDSANRIWTEDSEYDATNKVPGYVSGGTTGSNTGVSIVNTDNDTLYHTYRQGATLSYSFDVPNGNYTVKLYFAELDATINGGANRRRADISIEGSTVLSNYSPYEATGSTGKANIRVFDTSVSDGVLNVVITRSGSSNQNPRLAAIAVRPHV